MTKRERVKLFRILSIFKLTPDCEYTFEINPGNIDDDLLDDIVEGGVNRVSIGVESFDQDKLKVLEREINYDDLEEKISLIRKRGIENINLDLMYAIPGENVKVKTRYKKINKFASYTYFNILLNFRKSH